MQDTSCKKISELDPKNPAWPCHLHPLLRDLPSFSVLFSSLFVFSALGFLDALYKDVG